MRVYPVFGKSPHLSAAGERVWRFVSAIRHDAPWHEWRTGDDGCADFVLPMLDCNVELQFADEFEDLGWFRGTPAERLQLLVKERR